MSGEPQFAFGLHRALNARPAQGQIQTRYLRGFNSLVYSLGADPRSILERHEIDPLAFVDPDSQLECLSAATMVEYCGSRLDDPVFGLRLADVQEPDVFGPVAALARAAPTLRAALQCLVDYLPVFHSPEGVVEVLEGAETVEIRWSTRADLNLIQQPKLHGYGMMLKTLRMLGGAALRPLKLRLGFDLGPAGVAALGERARCRVVKGEANGVVLPRHALDRPLLSADSLVFDLLGGYLASASREAEPSIETRIEAFVRSALPFGSCTVERCAARLGLSVRGLQKRLARTERSFSQIVEAQRMTMARAALQDERRSLDEIALSLGYSDQTCFGRAFKRWTGQTPQGFRGASLC